MARTDEVGISHFLRGRPGERREERVLLGEAPLTIEVPGGDSFTVTRTPGADRELAVGLLFTRGLIESAGDVLTLAEDPGDPDRIKVTLAGQRREPAALPPAPEGPEVSLETLYGLPARVGGRQELFRATGASHAAALFDAEGGILSLHEDLSRHGALQKALGGALLAGIATRGRGVFVTGRVSLEMVQEAARARVGLLAAVGAATAAAVELAARLGVTLCGFVRGEEVTVYTHPRRIRSG